jgi:hypothetical protein
MKGRIVRDLSNDPLLEFRAETATASHARNATASSDGRAASARPHPWSSVSISLVVGIAIGFATGYTLAERLPPQRRVATEVIEPTESATSRPVGSTRSEGSANAAIGVAPDPESAAFPQAEAVTDQDRRAVAERGAPVAVESITQQGSLEIVSRPSGAQVSLDGRVVGATPLSLPAVRKGVHDVLIELPGYNRWSTSVVVTTGNRTRVGASLEP